MGTTVDGLIDRMYREYLSPMNDSMLFVRVNEALDTTETAVTLNVADGILAPEEVDLLGEGVRFEVDYEEMLITNVGIPGITLTVVRAWNNTTAASHVDGSVAYIAPWVSRQAVYEAVADAIVDLGAEIWIEHTRSVVVGLDPTILPAGTSEIVSFELLDGTDGGHLKFHSNYEPSTTKRAVTFYHAPAGTEGYLTYYTKFPRPTAITDDLTAEGGDWEIPLEWFRIIFVDSLATLISARQTDQVQTDFITELLAQEGFDIEESQNVVSALLGIRGVWVDRLTKRVRQNTGGIRTVIKH